MANGELVKPNYGLVSKYLARENPSLDEYDVKEANVLSFEEASEIYENLVATLDLNDNDTKELWDDLLESAMKYAAVRSNWMLLTREERLEKDKSRTMQHDSFIISLNVLSRYLKKTGKDVSWRTQLGDDKEKRKRIGDFACLVAYVYGLNAR